MFRVFVTLNGSVEGQWVTLDTIDLGILFNHKDCTVKFESLEKEMMYEEESYNDSKYDICYDQQNYMDTITSSEIIENAIWIEEDSNICQSDFFDTELSNEFKDDSFSIENIDTEKDFEYVSPSGYWDY